MHIHIIIPNLLYSSIEDCLQLLTLPLYNAIEGEAMEEQAKQQQIWWKKNQRLLVIVGVVIIVLFILIALAIYSFGWDWTGLNGGYSTRTTMSTSHGITTTTQKPPGKTLWDLLQLVIIPVALAFIAVIFNRAANRTEQEIAAQRYKNDQEITAQRYKNDQRLADDKQKEELLQGYFDRMSELLLKEHLRESSANSEVRNIARARTLSVLNRLDPVRKGSLIEFLYESNLLDKENVIIGLNDANLVEVVLDRSLLINIDLSSVNLAKARLDYAKLSSAKIIRANLSEAQLFNIGLSSADLSNAILKDAHLRHANLAQAVLFEAILSGADLSGANLSSANLGHADLSDTNLSGANLSDANLAGAIVTTEQLEKADSLQRAIMPDGLPHP
jgi:uncharacterized protein YjbI with pentapeptide repeats